MSRRTAIVIAIFLGWIIGLEILIIALIPGWERPEGLAAGAIWGGIVIASVTVGLITSALTAASVAAIKTPKTRKSILMIDLGLILVFGIAILLMFIFSKEIDKMVSERNQAELQALEAELRSKHAEN